MGNNNYYDGDLEKFIKKLKGKKKQPSTDLQQSPNETVPKQTQPFQTKKWLPSIIAAVVAFAAILIILTNVYIVKENEFKIVRQFGEVTKFESEPGIHMKIPFIQTVTSLPKNLLTHDMTQEEINTKDKKRIIIDNYAVWKITNPKQLITNARSLENAETRMSEFIYSVLRTELGQLNYEDIINDENSSRGSINDRVTEKVNELLLNDQYGIEVVDVRIRRTDLPVENEQSVYTRMISERQSIAQKYLSEGDAEKRTREAETDRSVQQQLAEAKRKAAIVTAEGESEAAKIYNEAFSKDPEFYSLYRTLESYKKTIGKDTVIIIPSDSPYAKLLSGYFK